MDSYDSVYNCRRREIIVLTKTNYKELYKRITKIRDIVEDTTLCLFGDFEHFKSDNGKADSSLLYLIQSLFLRMVKTSKVISDLNVQGDYVEALSLLRNNFEKETLILHLILNPNLIEKWSAKGKSPKEQRKDQRNYFSMPVMTSKIKKDYLQYRTLCLFVHPKILPYDTSVLLGFDSWGILVKRYPEFSQEDFYYIYELNHNVLVETFNMVKKFILGYADKKKIEDYKKIINRSKKFNLIKIKVKKSKNFSNLRGFY